MTGDLSAAWLWALADEALRQYGLAAAERVLIRHNENGAFAVTDAPRSRRYLLRVHEPASANLRGIQHTFEGLRSEMAVLGACREGTGLPLQQPVTNNAGRLVTTANDAGTGVSALCTLLTWVDGEAFDPASQAAPVLARRLGSTTAAMHAWARGWQPEQPLVRPVYDAAKYEHLVDRIGLGVQAGLLSAADFAAIQATMSAIRELFGSLPRTPTAWGLLHADLKPDNVIVSGEQMVPIDFCFCGFGYYLFDVGCALTSFKPHLRPPYLEGYLGVIRREFTAAELRLIDACFVLSIFGGIGFSITNRRSHEWIQRRMPAWLSDYFVPYLEGRRVVDR